MPASAAVAEALLAAAGRGVNRPGLLAAPGGLTGEEPFPGDGAAPQPLRRQAGADAGARRGQPGLLVVPVTLPGEEPFPGDGVAPEPLRWYFDADAGARRQGDIALFIQDYRRVGDIFMEVAAGL